MARCAVNWEFGPHGVRLCHLFRMRAQCSSRLLRPLTSSSCSSLPDFCLLRRIAPRRRDDRECFALFKLVGLLAVGLEARQHGLHLRVVEDHRLAGERGRPILVAERLDLARAPQGLVEIGPKAIWP